MLNCPRPRYRNNNLNLKKFCAWNTLQFLMSKYIVNLFLHKMLICKTLIFLVEYISMYNYIHNRGAPWGEGREGEISPTLIVKFLKNDAGIS